MPLFLFGIAWFDLITTKPLLTQFAKAACAGGTQAAALGEASGTLPGRLTHPVPNVGQHFAFGTGCDLPAPAPSPFLSLWLTDGWLEGAQQQPCNHSSCSSALCGA